MIDAEIIQRMYSTYLFKYVKSLYTSMKSNNDEAINSIRR